MENNVNQEFELLILIVSSRPQPRHSVWAQRRDLLESGTVPNPRRSLRFGPMNRAYGREDTLRWELSFMDSTPDSHE
jgi:hypothetical protein